MKVTHHISLALLLFISRYKLMMMLDLDELDYIALYEAAQKVLAGEPDNAAAQYASVLNLARAGATQASLKAYEAFNLGRLSKDEDALALKGRLHKDLFLSAQTPQNRTEHLAASIQAYRAAFEATGGYFSAINAASLIHISRSKAEHEKLFSHIEKVLREADESTPRGRYFLMASRAEWALLNGDIDTAKSGLREALRYDPLGYAAHATTLKQFRMILKNTGQDAAWLDDFAPPKAVHFTGHIFAPLPDEDRLNFESHIVDRIQSHDIGFAYGALAAGSDICLIEAIQSEGGHVHIVLPVPIPLYKKLSVSAFGKAWATRFDACLEKAASVDILTQSKSWPDQKLDRAAARIAMGKALLRAPQLGNDALQIHVIADPQNSSWSRAYSEDWQRTGHNQITLPPPSEILRPFKSRKALEGPDFPVLAQKGGATVQFDTAGAAARWALGQAANGDVPIALTYDLPDGFAARDLFKLKTVHFPGAVICHEPLACLLAWEAGSDFHIHFAGSLPVENGAPLRVYTMSLAS